MEMQVEREACLEKNRFQVDVLERPLIDCSSPSQSEWVELECCNYNIISLTGDLIDIVCSGSIVVATLDSGPGGSWFESRVDANILWGSIDCTGLTQAFKKIIN